MDGKDQPRAYARITDASISDIDGIGLHVVDGAAVTGKNIRVANCGVGIQIGGAPSQPMAAPPRKVSGVGGKVIDFAAAVAAAAVVKATMG